MRKKDKHQPPTKPHLSSTLSQALHSAIAKSSPHLVQHRKGQVAVWFEHSGFTLLLPYSGAGYSHWGSFFKRKICSHVRSPRVSSPLGNCSCVQFSTGCSDVLLGVLFQGNTSSKSPSQGKGEYPLPQRFHHRLHLPLFIFCHWCSQNSFLLLCSFLLCLYRIFWPLLKMFSLIGHDLGWGVQPCLVVAQLGPAGSGYLCHRPQIILLLLTASTHMQT